MATFVLMVTAAVFVLMQSIGSPLGFWLGFKPALLPPLMVYAGLTVGPRAIVAVAIVGGVLHDSLSLNPFGLTVLPLGVVGLLLNYTQPYLFREELTQQLLLGALASLAAALMELAALALWGSAPAFSFWLLLRLALIVVSGALVTPLVFWVLDFLHQLLGAIPPKYETPSASWSRGDARRYGPPKELWRERSYK